MKIFVMMLLLILLFTGCASNPVRVQCLNSHNGSQIQGDADSAYVSGSKIVIIKDGMKTILPEQYLCFIGEVKQ